MFISEALANNMNTQPTFLGSMMPLLIFVIIFYLFLIRPHQKKTKEHGEKVKGLKSGDKVITGGGIIGVVKKNKEDILIVEIGKNIEIEVVSNTVNLFLEKEEKKK